MLRVSRCWQHARRALPFLGLFWLSMILTGGATVNAGWLYVGARALYPVAALAKGIKPSGPQAPILLRLAACSCMCMHAQNNSAAPAISRRPARSARHARKRTMLLLSLPAAIAPPRLRSTVPGYVALIMCATATIKALL